jgi:hypothetical protein
MPSFDKQRDAEMEAGLPLMGATSEKAQSASPAADAEEPATARPQMSPRRRFFCTLFITGFVTFTLLRGVALMTMVCTHGHHHAGAHGAMVGDNAMPNEASVSMEELCKVYPEYCPEDIKVIQKPETVPSGVLGKRQNDGAASTPSDSEGPSSTDEPTSSTAVPIPSSSAADDTSSVVPPSSSAPLPSSQEPPTSRTTEQSSTAQQSTAAPTSSEQEESSAAATSSAQTSSERPTSSSGTSRTSEAPASSAPVSSRSRPASSAPNEDESTTSQPSSSSSSRRTVTTGTVKTSSAEEHVYTTTREDGAPATLTSVSWVDFVPSEPTGSSDDPELQGSASSWQRSMILQVAMGVLVGGILMV